MAKDLGYQEDGCFRVRKEMLKEATEYQAVYFKLQGGNKPMKTIVQNLQVEKGETRVKPNKWVSRLDHGQILANTYGSPIIFLSLKDCRTYLPLRIGPQCQSDSIYLLRINNNH